MSSTPQDAPSDATPDADIVTEPAAAPDAGADGAAGADAARERVRVWAEDETSGQVLLTWEAPASRGINRAAGTRTILATLELQNGVSSVVAIDEGFKVTFDPAETSPPALAAALREALDQPELTTRLRDVLTRGPAYLSLARSASMDERVSPLQEIRRQSARRASPAAAVTRFVPGAQLVTRAQTLVPVLMALRTWSRDASPQDVQQHFAAAGLERTQLDRDLATLKEAGGAVKDIAQEGLQTVRGHVRGRFSEAAQRTRERFNEELHRDDEPAQGRAAQETSPKQPEA